MAFIKVIPYEESEGFLRSLYDDLIRKRGKLADVHIIQSLNPETIVTHMDLYLSIMFGQSPLSRAQRDMIAVVVSGVNRCAYCQTHHAQALLHYWKDQKKVNALRNDYKQAGLTDGDRILCAFAELLTAHPDQAGRESVESVKKAGFDDRSVLDAVLVVGYFNFVNRIVLGLGVHIEQDNGKGYQY
jgi:uncharacterized peroxidase-related enzyme